MAYLIDYGDIADLIEENANNYREGKKYVDSDTMMSVGISQDSPNGVEVLALFASVSDPLGPPRVVNLSILYNEFENIIHSCTCSCKVGILGTCKHSLAVMIYLCENRRVELATGVNIAQLRADLGAKMEAMLRPMPLARMSCHHMGR